jgi:hypothetical protein
MATTATTFEFRQEFDRKLEIVTAGLPPEYSRLLQDKIPRQHAIAVNDYITSLNAEVNPSHNYRKDVIKCLARFIAFCHDNNKKDKAKELRQLERKDVLVFLDSLRKTEIADPLHRWIGTCLKLKTYPPEESLEHS